MIHPWGSHVHLYAQRRVPAAIPAQIVMPGGSSVTAVFAGPSAGIAAVVLAVIAIVLSVVVWLFCTLAVDPRAGDACERLSAAQPVPSLEDDGEDPGMPAPREWVAAFDEGSVRSRADANG
ncbi:MAG: hypothetical protein ABR604_10115 [Jatrophihabitantaceae bacterium]